MIYQAKETRYENMPYQACGQSGLKLPRVSLGLWHNFGESARMDTMRDMLRAAFDHGITHFDLANNYGPPPGSAEEHFGRIYQDDFKPYRDELIISSKAGYTMWPGPYGDFGSRKYLIASLDQSLRRMGLDYVDIFYHHRPDPNTPLEETMMALAQIVRSGKALYIGLSNYEPESLERAHAILKEEKLPFVICQNSCSMFNLKSLENGFFARNKELGLGHIAYSPLAQGLLTDRYLQGVPQDARVKTDGRFLQEKDLTEDRMNQVRALNELAQSSGMTLAQMALLFVLKMPAMTSVLIGASKVSQILDCAAIQNLPELNAEHLDRIFEILNLPKLKGQLE